MNLFVTGATGFLGKEVLARLVQDEMFETIYVLIRPSRSKSAKQRLEQMLRKMFPSRLHETVLEKIVPIAGDLTKPRLGLTADSYRDLAKSVHQILHIGASTDFGAPLETARSFNVEGTREVLRLALDSRRSGSLQRFDYVSTAFVSGTKSGWVAESDLVRGQEFANSYEQSKYEAEVLVRSYMNEIPTCIFRPSIVVGDSHSGYTPHFKVLYWPLRLLALNVMPFIACNLNARLDVVPVDYVAKGMIACLKDDRAIERTIYLTAGEGGEVSIREFLLDAYEYAGINRVPIVPFWFFNMIRCSPLARLVSGEAWEAMEMARPYYEYLKGTQVVFNNARSQEYLEGLGVCLSPWAEYKREILRYCQLSHWGKRLPMPEYAYYLPAEVG